MHHMRDFSYCFNVTDSSDEFVLYWYYCFSCGEKLMGFVCLFVFAVHKQRDIVPLDVNGDVGNSNSDYETPVFDLKVSVCPFYIKLY